jgi:magnesium chelatase family protein
MLGRATGAVLIGVDARLVDVEVDLGGGLPTIAAVGLLDHAVREGIDRIRAALPHASFRLPQHRAIFNLAPAEVRKQGTGLDVPMAMALLAADGQVRGAADRDTVLAGELALDGSLRPVRGALSIALAAVEAGKKRLVVPQANADEAALAEAIEVIGASTLSDVVAAVSGVRVVPHRVDARSLLAAGETRGSIPDLRDVRGQAGARRALEVAAAGGHHLLLVGPPGAGKTMPARRLPGILPPMSLAEAIEVTRIWSAAGLSRGLVTSRPFRSPHHGVSFAGLTGGGPRLRPGEISLANDGVLYLDEMPEFRRDALEALRQPLEDGVLTVSRVHGTVTFPTRFMLVGSMNGCPCGFYGSPGGRCGCTPSQIRRYRSKLSGPLLDRFDLVVEVPPVDLAALARASAGEPSRDVRDRVVAARARQRARFGTTGPSCNARMGSRELEAHAALGPGPTKLLERALAALQLSARGYDRIRRVASTLADLDGVEILQERHVAEAVQYRRAGAALGEGG